jgi:hypothetical protein
MSFYFYLSISHMSKNTKKYIVYNLFLLIQGKRVHFDTVSLCDSRPFMYLSIYYYHCKTIIKNQKKHSNIPKINFQREIFF